MSDERHDRRSPRTQRDQQRDDENPRRRREEDDPVTAGERVSDEFGLDQPTDERDVDRGEGREEPTPNPADLAP